jgi:pimeloyl-ACP methyl ester carboxylesterase
MARNPIVLVHGYSDKGRSFARWEAILAGLGYEVTEIYVGNYVSLSNEVSVKDIAEGFDRALRWEARLDPNQPFDAIVHSTGMLVVRSWLSTYAAATERRRRLKRLIALAPATFGSPLAHKGRSWLGSVFKGSRQLGPDFMEAGDQVLHALELGSDFTWDLAHRDLIGEDAVFSNHEDSPFVFTFCGNRGYGGLTRLVNPHGTDGTVRWAGCPLNSRKISIDLMEDAAVVDGPARISLAPWGNPHVPLIAIDDVDHGSILRSPPDQLVEYVTTALDVTTRDEFVAWVDGTLEQSRQARAKMGRWQQFVIKVVDERGDPVNDWNIQLFQKRQGRASLDDFDMHVHVYAGDKSLRCFHVDLEKLQPESLDGLYMKLIASTGTSLVGYHGMGSERLTAAGRNNPRGKWDAQLDLSQMVQDGSFRFFFPFTTTLVQIQLNREPMPLKGRNDVFWFQDRA